jgi:hypothetical protein
MAETERETSTETARPVGQPPAGLARWRLPLPFVRPLLNLNEMKGKHWSRSVGDYRTLVEAGYYLSRHHKLPRPILSAVTVELIYWPGNNSVHDPDNMAPTLKGLLDGVRKAGVLVDDRGRYVRSAICTVIERADDPTDSAKARMALVIQEIDQTPRLLG